MNHELMRQLSEILAQVQGFIYPNEIEIHWGMLIVVYPYLTGVVAGAFILASLVKVFNVKEVQPLYRLSLLTALAYLLVAPLALVSHLGHPERFYEILLTPQTSSAMAMFGFVYAWYLMAVLLLEIWFVYRPDMIALAEQRKGRDAVRLPGAVPLLPGHERAGGGVRPFGPQGHHRRRHPVRLPPPRLRRVHLRVGQGEPLVEQRADADRLPLLRHRVRDRAGPPPLHDHRSPGGRKDRHELRRQAINFLFYAVIVDFSLEMIDFIHRVYQSEEEIEILSELVMNKLFMSLVIIQVLLGMLLPLGSSP